MRRRAFIYTSSYSVLLGAAGARAQSQKWPARPIRLLISSGSGSGVDRAGRLIADRMSHGLSNPIVVENKAGGQNVIGALTAARSPPDGYTVYLATTAALVSNRFLIKDLPYDPVNDFSPVGFVGYSPFVITVRDDSPISSLQDLIKRAKAAPGSLTMANEGPKTFGGITSRLFSHAAGIELNLISYPSAANGLQDMLGGHVESILCDLATVAPTARAGKLRIIGVTTARRLPDWDAPALAEFFPGFEMIGWFGMVVPHATPSEIVSTLNRELDTALKDDAVKSGLSAVGFMTDGAGTPAEMTKFVARQNERWVDISRDVGLLAE